MRVDASASFLSGRIQLLVESLGEPMKSCFRHNRGLGSNREWELIKETDVSYEDFTFTGYRTLHLLPQAICLVQIKQLGVLGRDS